MSKEKSHKRVPAPRKSSMKSSESPPLSHSLLLFPSLLLSPLNLCYFRRDHTFSNFAHRKSFFDVAAQLPLSRYISLPSHSPCPLPSRSRSPFPFCIVLIFVISFLLPPFPCSVISCESNEKRSVGATRSRAMLPLPSGFSLYSSPGDATTPRNDATQRRHATTPRNEAPQRGDATRRRNEATQRGDATRRRNEATQRGDATRRKMKGSDKRTHLAVVP